MATVTLSANTNYSALTVANGDTIELAGFTLNFDVVPAETGVIVQTPGTTGKLTFVLTTTYPLTGWTMTAGTDTLIASVSAGQDIGGSILGGSSGNKYGVGTNNGTLNSVARGSATNAYGCNVNNGTIATAGSWGVGTNNGTVGSATGGAFTSGVVTNNGYVAAASGGTGANSVGVMTNNGTVGSSTGGSGSGSHGVSTCNGMITGAMTDATGKAVNTWNGSTCFVDGPNCNAVIPNNMQTIYSLGALSGGATISGTATVIELDLAGGGGGGNIIAGGGFRGGLRRGA